jgi:hypothetical protein
MTAGAVAEEAMLAAPSIGERVIASFNAYDGLVDGLRARIAELQVSTATLDAVSGLPAGYTSKIVSKRQIRKLGIKSLSDLLGALGLRGQLVEDSAALAKVAGRLKKRDAKRVRDDSTHVVLTGKFMRSIGKKGAAARNARLTAAQRSELARRAANARWRAAP